MVGEISAVQRAGCSGLRIQLQNLRGHSRSVFGSSHQVCLSSDTAAINENTAFHAQHDARGRTPQRRLAIEKLHVDHAPDRRQLRRTSAFYLPSLM